MKFKAIIGAVGFTLKKYSPEILMGVGIAGVVGSTVMACAATLKAEEILDSYESKKERIDDCVLVRETSEVDYSLAEEKADRRTLACATAGKFIRLYGPSATLMLGSIGCILAAHHIMKQRNVALMAAYKVLEESFSKYRKRVAAKYGEAADAEFYYGGAEDQVVETTTDENGNETTKIHNTGLSGFSREFSEEVPDQIGGWSGSTQWSKRHEYNLSFLSAKEDHFNRMLLTKGFVTMNDVYAELGFAPTEAGMICGWRYKSERGDGFISFRPRGIDGNWNYGQDGDSIILDFNIDGVIFDQNVARKEMK